METETSTYKMVADRVDLARRLETLVESQATTVATSLARLFAGYSDQPEEYWYPDELLRQRLLVRYVAGLRREMVAAAQAHWEATRELDALRAEQAEAVDELYAELVEVRRQARAAYGPQAAWVVGLKGRTERNPHPLAAQAGEAVVHLSWPGSATDKRSELADRRAWVETLAPPLARLRSTLDAVRAGEAETIGTLKAKRGTMKNFDERFGCVGRYVKAAYEMVELDELAARVPPRTPRKSRRKTRSERVRSAERPARQRRAAFSRFVEMGRRMAGRFLRRA